MGFWGTGVEPRAKSLKSILYCMEDDDDDDVDDDDDNDEDDDDDDDDV